MSQPPPNPYAPPRFESDLVPFPGGAGGRVHREGDLVVIPVQGASLPPRCVVCNASADRRMKRKLYWHPPGVYALLCLGAVFYVIGALILRKKAEFEMGVCNEHAARRRNGILIGVVGVPLGFLVMGAAVESSPIFIVLGLLVMLGSLVAAVLMVQLVSAKRIDERQAWLKVGRPFLDSL
jgi:hypothetical protein